MLLHDPALHISGLAFFAMGLAVWLKTTPLRNLPISRAFRWLAVFGITNGVYQWLILYRHGVAQNYFYDQVTVVIAATSYLALAVFAARIVDPQFNGFRLFGGHEKSRRVVQRLFHLIPYVLFLTWLALHSGWHWLQYSEFARALYLDDITIHQSPRYLLALPSALLAALSFARLSPFGGYGKRVQLYAQLTSFLFLNYAALSVFSGSSDLFPSPVLNNSNFMAFVGIPVDLLRAVTAAGIGISVVAALSLFDREERAAIERTVLDATARLDEKVAELEKALGDQRKTEERLEEQATLFRTVLDTVPVPVLVRDNDLRLTFINRPGLEFFGRPADAMLGKTIAETYARDAYEPLETFQRKALSLPPGKTLTLPEFIPITNPDKTVLLRAAPIALANGEKRGVVSVTINLSDLRKAEKRLFESEALLQSMLDHIPGTVGLRSPDGRYLVLGAGCKDWYHQSREDLIGKTIDDIWSPDMAKAIRFRDRQTIETGELTDFEAQTTFPNGDVRTTRTIRFPVRNEDGSLRGIGFLASDVTAEKLAEEQLRQAQKMEAVGQLTGGIAHDFNNLLGIIIGNLDFLEEQLRDDSEKHALVTAATNAALNGATLNRQLLAFSRKQALEPKKINLNTQIPDMLEMLRRSLPATITITALHAPDLWNCFADASQVESALLNLALNARDAMPDGGKLTIQTGNRHINSDAASLAGDLSPGDFAMLSVSDTGTGMSAEALKHAFEPFFTTKPVGQGSGLGLSMVYGFAKQSDGHVTIESAKGRGTTVCLYLPRYGDAEPENSLEQDTTDNPAHTRSAENNSAAQPVL